MIVLLATLLISQADQWSNNAATTLAAPITSASTSLFVSPGQGALFQTPGNGYFITLESGPVANPSAREIVRVTARATDTFTIVRAQQGTTAQAFAIGDRVEQRITAGSLTSFCVLEAPSIITSSMIVDGTVTLTDMAASTADAAAGTASLRSLGTTAITAAAGNHTHSSGSAMLLFGNDLISATNATRYLHPGYVAATAPTTPIQFRLPRAGTVRNLRVFVNSPAGNGALVTYTLRVNSVATLVSVSMASTMADGSNLVNTAVVAAGALVEVEVAKPLAVGSSPGGVTASFEYL